MKRFKSIHDVEQLLEHPLHATVERMTSVEVGLTLHCYWSSNCPACSLKSQCTTGKERRVAR